MRKVLFALPLVLLIAFGAFVLWRGLDHDPEYRAAALVGQPLPALTLPSLADGEPTPLRPEVRGPTVVNVFASWCGPCRIEHPHLTAIQHAGVPVIGLAHRDDPAASRAFLAELGDPFRLVLVDRDGRAGVELGVTAVPETFLVDANGTIVDKVTGPLDAASRDRLIAAARRNRGAASPLTRN